MEENIFEQIMQRCTEKKVVSCCRKLIKKSALTSGAVATTFAELAYWLFIYNHIEDALLICELAHIEKPKPYKVNFNIWDRIIHVWGLEAYIYRKKGLEEKCQSIVKEIDEIYHIPAMQGNDSIEQINSLEEKRRNRITFEYVTNSDEVSEYVNAGNKSSANVYRFSALAYMVSYSVTGFYPQLNERKDEIESLIDEYISFLK